MDYAIWSIGNFFLLTLCVYIIVPSLRVKALGKFPMLKGLFAYRKTAILYAVISGVSFYYDLGPSNTKKPLEAESSKVVAVGTSKPNAQGTAAQGSLDVGAKVGDAKKKDDTSQPKNLSEFQARDGYRSSFLSCPEKDKDYQPFLEIHSVPGGPRMKWYAVRAFFLNKAGKLAVSPMVFWNVVPVDNEQDIIRSRTTDAAPDYAPAYSELFDTLRNNARVLKNEYKNRFPVLDSVVIFNYNIFVNLKRNSLELYWDRTLPGDPDPRLQEQKSFYTQCEIITDTALSDKMVKDAKQLLDDVSSALSVLDSERKAEKANRKI